MSAIETLEQSLNSAQNELADAEIALAEATARAESARESAARLKAAVAALNGESPPPAAPSRENFAGEALPCKEVEGGSNPSLGSTDPLEDMTPEEFDAHRRKRQREREKEELANNPLAHVKCQGCGTKGRMSEQFVTAPSGSPVRMLVCGKCGNQVL